MKNRTKVAFGLAVIAALVAGPGIASADEVVDDTATDVAVTEVVEAPAVEEPAAPAEEVVPEATEPVVTPPESWPVEAEKGPSPEQKITNFYSWLVPEGVVPADNKVGKDGFPQTLIVQGAIEAAGVPCGRFAQIDEYHGTPAAIEAVVGDGVLDYKEDYGIVKSWSFVEGTQGCTPPPPANTCASENVGPTSTNLVPLWTNVDTRSAGHYEYVEGGLHIWTDDNSSQAKVSLGYPASFPLKHTGVLDLGWTGSTPPPGINLFIQTPNGNGTLVYESVYGQDLWLTNGSAQWLKDNAPVNGGGNGSQWHGTIDQWLTVIPDAQVVGIAFSLGSGVLGDGVISHIIAGCTQYDFAYVEPAPEPEPAVEYRDSSVVDCESMTVTTTYEARNTEPATFDPATNSWTLGPWTDWYETDTETTEATVEECPPTPTPTPTPTNSVPTPGPSDTPLAATLGGPATTTLSSTGGGDVSPYVPLAAGLASALGLVLLFLGRAWARRRNA